MYTHSLHLIIQLVIRFCVFGNIYKKNMFYVNLQCVKDNVNTIHKTDVIILVFYV